MPRARSPPTSRRAGRTASPGTPGATGAARWFTEQLAPYGYQVRQEHFTADVAGRGRVHLVNLLAFRPGRSQKTILLMAHRDDSGSGAGANDNASGTAALLELARAYAPAAGTTRVPLPYTLAFLSTDGAVDGGARRGLVRGARAERCRT